MKNWILLLIFFIFFSAAYAKTTRFSKFAAKQYAEQNSTEKIYINVKKEHIQEFQQNFQNNGKAYMVFGYGDMKTGKKKKSRISYTVILDSAKKPVWSSITESN